MNIIRHILLLIIGSLCSMLAKAASEGMPIIGYFGVPDWQTTEKNFRNFSECGFTVSLYPIYPTIDLLVKACRYAEKYGIKVIGKCPEMISKPSKVAQTLKQEKGFFGYLMQDEPNVPDIHQRQEEIKRLRQTDSTHCFYINLFPYYHHDWIEPSTKAKNYPEYLRALSKTACQQLSFDFYPITAKGIRPTWYHNLEMVHQESLASGKPFWGFVLSVPHDVPFEKGNYYPTPTLASLRLQVYSNLVYGAQAIQYFTYWNPGNEEGLNYHDAPISRNGMKTKTYYLVQQMNQELKIIAPLFYGSKVLSVHHLGGELPQGTTRLTQMPINLKSLKVVSRKGAIISQLEKNGHRYLAIVNKNHEDTIKVLIKPLNHTPCHLTKTLKKEPMKDIYTIFAGDILLFKLK